MSKAEVNNEVILMRSLVRKAKVRIIRNLIREIKILRLKRGDEKKKIKFNRRADRFLEEVNVARKVKDDEITKFGIANTRSLYSILDDVTSDAHTRVIAKFADFPDLKKRISEFKAKFPNYEQLLGPGRKKLARLQRKAALKEKKDEEKTNEGAGESHLNTEKKPRKVKVDSFGDEEKKESSDNEMDVDSDEVGIEDDGEEKEDKFEDGEAEGKHSDGTEDSAIETLKPRLKSKSTKRLKPEPENTKSESETEVENVPVVEKVDKKISKTLKKEKIKKNRKVNVKEIKAVSQEATVKRFVELLQGEEEGEVNETRQKVNSELKTNEVKLEHEADSFLMSDGGKEYLSVAVPKKQIEDENSINDDFDHSKPHMRRKFSRNTNDRFIANINKFEEQSDNARKNKRMDRNNSGFEPKYKNRSRNEARSIEQFVNKSNNKFDKKFGNKSDKKTETSDKHLHPSWAAKKKEQDALKLGFQGKKIVFGDD